MKHTKKTALTAALLTAAVSMTAGVTLTSCYPQVVYGPPESYETPSKATDSTTTTPTVPATTAYEPSTEEIQDVYGPPPVEEEDTTAAVTEVEVLPEETTSVTAYEGSDTTTKPIDMQLVYGPPNAIDD